MKKYPNQMHRTPGVTEMPSQVRILHLPAVMLNGG